MNDLERRRKLEAIATQDDSPREAEIARAKLAGMGDRGRIPPQRPPTTGGVYPEPIFYSMTINSAMPSATAWWSFNFNTGG